MPTEMTVTMDGNPPSEAKVTQIILSEGKRAMREGMLLIEAEAKRRVPVRTGHLRRSLASNVHMAGLVITGTVGTDVFYGPFLDRGTGLYGPLNHWIVPKTAKALRFPAGPAGFTLAGRVRKGKAGAAAKYTFARKVRGVRPRYFMEDSQLVTRPKVLAVFEDHARQAAKRIERAVH